RSMKKAKIQKPVEVREGAGEFNHKGHKEHEEGEDPKPAGFRKDFGSCHLMNRSSFMSSLCGLCVLCVQIVFPIRIGSCRPVNLFPVQVFPLWFSSVPPVWDASIRRSISGSSSRRNASQG